MILFSHKYFSRKFKQNHQKRSRYINGRIFFLLFPLQLQWIRDSTYIIKTKIRRKKKSRKCYLLIKIFVFGSLHLLFFLAGGIIQKNIVYIRKHLSYTIGRLPVHYCIGIFGLDERQFSKDKDLQDLWQTIKCHWKTILKDLHSVWYT